MTRLPRAAVEEMMDTRPETTLEAALEVFEVFASGSLTDEVYILDDVGGKRIAIAPAALKEKYRRGGAPALHLISPQMGAGGPGGRQGPPPGARASPAKQGGTLSPPPPHHLTQDGPPPLLHPH